MRKALVTGGTSGLGAEIVRELGQGSLGVGRGAGWDLSCSDQIEGALVELSLQFDVFVNYAYLNGLLQKMILSAVVNSWAKNDKSGLIVNFGSYATYSKKRRDDPYAEYKRALDDFCYDWSKKGQNGEVRFRLTNLRPGYLDMEKNKNKPHYLGYGVNARHLVRIIDSLWELEDLIIPDMVVSVIDHD